MTTQVKQAQSLFPDIPREIPTVDKEGNFTALWSLGFGALFQALQENFKNEGILFPSLDASQIATIQAIYTPLIGGSLPQDIPVNNGEFIPDISGQTVFDTTNRVPKQFIISYVPATSPPIISSARWWTFTLT